MDVESNITATKLAAAKTEEKRTPANLSSRRCVIIGNILKYDLVERSFDLSS